MGFEATEIIPHPVDLVWAVATEPGVAGHWLGVANYRRMNPSEPLGEGSRLIFTARGQAHVNVITRFEVERCLTLSSTHGGITAVYAYSFEELGDATRVRLEALCEARGFFWKLVRPFVDFLMTRSDRDQLAAMAQVAGFVASSRANR